MKKHNIYLCQVNNRYGNNVFFPYSVGMLQAYCQTIEEITEHFDFKGFIYLREDPDRVVARLEDPKIVGISCYIWNWEYSKTLARKIVAAYPNCLIVFGGPQVPLRSENFFVNHPYVDILVHYEGELSFSQILLEYLSQEPDYTQISGLSVKVSGLQTFVTPSKEPISDLAQLPSPYLAGVFDKLIREPYKFNACQETHRGCPYSCTFCDWGSATLSKVRKFDDARLEAEFEWFGQNGIEFITNCDANYGLFPRDYDLTVKVCRTKAKYGFPRKFKAAYAKNSNMKIFEIAKALEEAGMCKGITLSFQSLDSHTLDVVKRSNIKIDNFEKLLRLYYQEGIATYTEMILGLPGETYESFVKGLNQLIEAGQHDSVNVYYCTVLPNADMGKPEYQKLHGIKTVQVPILLGHSTPAPDPITEYNDMVVETNAMTTQDWRRTFLFSWAVQCFHCLSLTQYLAIFMFTEFGISYRVFYEKLLNYIQQRPHELAGQQFQFVSDILTDVSRGGSWDMVIPKFGNIVWPIEEGTFLNIVYEKNRFYAEIATFMRELIDEFNLAVDEELLTDLLRYQAEMIIDPFSPKAFVIELCHNLHDYFLDIYQGNRGSIVKVAATLEVQADVTFGGELETYAREIIWYGRKGGRFRHSNVTVKINEFVPVMCLEG